MADWKTPADLRYTQHDEWARVEGDEVVVGVTDYAQDQLSDIVYVELPDLGASFAKDDDFGVIESVKAASDLYMPIGGEVVAINDALESTPEVINSDPYGDGWIVRLKVADASELDGLMDAAAYAAHCAERSA